MTERCAFAWVPDRVERLKRWCCHEAMSAQQIVDRFWLEDHERVTRNAIIAKTHRMGIRLNGSTGIRVAAARQRQPKPKVNGGGLVMHIRAQPPAAQTKPPPETFRCDGLMDLDMTNACRFPVGKTSWVYCGAPRWNPGNERYVYCAHHHRIAYRPAPRRTEYERHTFVGDSRQGYRGS